VAQIAEAAEVSPQTIYNTVGSKSDVLRAVSDSVDAAARVPQMLERMAATQDAGEILDLVAHLRRALMEEAHDVMAVLVAAAGADPEVAATYAEGQARSRAGIAGVVARLASLGALREGLEVHRAADIVYSLHHHTLWTRLVDECGWTPDEVEGWYAAILRRELLAT